MPAYDFKCSACGHEFTVVMTIKERETEGAKCPKCDGKAEPLLATFFAKTSRKS